MPRVAAAKNFRIVLALILGTLAWVSNAWLMTKTTTTTTTTTTTLALTPTSRRNTNTVVNNKNNPLFPSAHFSYFRSPFPSSSYSSHPRHHLSSTATSRHMASSEDDKSSSSSSSNLPFWLDIGTKGGAVFWSLVLFIVPIIGYNFVTGVLGYDEIEAGKWIGVGFTAFALLAWSSTYLFRVATKDMTYAKQLKDYENAVIAKRLEELDDDEIQALVEEIERDEF
mmetsp:Transcript_26987/g.76564  ORF Transcript_26987/g.76564 Transcript_26987/m.76564 type:complete len:225 (-) Transcript_26987:1-675(-)